MASVLVEDLPPSQETEVVVRPMLDYLMISVQRSITIFDNKLITLYK